MIYTTLGSKQARLNCVECKLLILLIDVWRVGHAVRFLSPRWGKVRIGVLRTRLKLMGTPSSLLPHQGEGGKRAGRWLSAWSVREW